MTEHQPEDSRRQQILNAAEKLFISIGYERTSVDQIAQQAGLSKGAIYWYFKSKLEILFALTDRNMLAGQNELRQLVEINQMGPDSLYRSHRYLHEMRECTHSCDRIFSQLIELSKRHPEIRDHLVGYYRDWDLLICELLDKAVQSGAFRPVNTILIAQAIAALYDGLELRRALQPDVDVLGVIELATRLFYDALIQPNHESVAK